MISLREAVILATLIVHPSLIHRFESALERLDLTGPDHNRLRDCLLASASESSDKLRQNLEQDAHGALETLFARTHVQIAPPVRNADDTELAMLCLAEELAKLDAHRGARKEIEDAVEDLSGLADEGLTWRLSQAALARHRADHPPREDATDLGEDRSALSKHLQNLIDGEIWVKKKG
jgi:DNA primase